MLLLFNEFPKVFTIDVTAIRTEVASVNIRPIPRMRLSSTIVVLASIYVDLGVINKAFKTASIASVFNTRLSHGLVYSKI